MDWERITLGPLQTNTYLCRCQGEVIIIDPALAGPVLERIRREQLEVSWILNTHGHADHVGGNLELHQETGAPIAIGHGDAGFLTDPAKNLSLWVAPGWELTGPAPHRLLKDGDEIPFGGDVIRVIATPGHTPGGVCFAWRDLLFAGDTLFRWSAGRTDLPGGDLLQLEESLARLATLPEMTVLPGHGLETSLRYEVQTNPFFPRSESR